VKNTLTWRPDAAAVVARIRKTPNVVLLDDLLVVLEGGGAVDEVAAFAFEVARPEPDEPPGAVRVPIGDGDVLVEGQPVVGGDLARQRCGEGADPFGALDDGHRPALLHLPAGMLPGDLHEAAAAGLGDVGHPALHLAALQAADPDIAVEVVEEVVGDDAAEPVLGTHINRRS
jgi:hypothetical protein